MHSTFWGLDMPTCKSGLCGVLGRCCHDAISDTTETHYWLVSADVEPRLLVEP